MLSYRPIVVSYMTSCAISYMVSYTASYMESNHWSKHCFENEVGRTDLQVILKKHARKKNLKKDCETYFQKLDTILKMIKNQFGNKHIFEILFKL